ncbi:MAG: sigma 54-interacting transcriptional regulator [Candidatus Zixiibacteriota bacterium]|nr:MAG: sigma 54-interacting transcriptional regulator [candidate division Zixibacteria bacterium]
MTENEANMISPDLPPDKQHLPTFMAAFHSDSFRNVLRMASQVAKFDSSVLLSGETGVGKEIIARYIHWLSPRSDKSMLTISCGALPETLLESELFGHKAGSFTGAIHDRVGLFEQAARGTVFLDEIGDISKTIQVKLLRVLQEREILRIGENIPRKVDIRTIAATNQDLDKAAAEGKFREDLLYRIRVVEIKVPALRERPEDIPPLTEHFVERLARRLRLPGLSLDRECLARFQKYAWPGNVRELQNAIEHAAIISGDGRIKLKHIPPQIAVEDNMLRRPWTGGLRPLEEMEIDYIRTVLQAVGGSRSRAAEVLGISQTTLWRKLKKTDGRNEAKE